MQITEKIINIICTCMYVKTLRVTSCSSLRKSYICMLAFQKVSLTVYSYPCINLNTRGWETINLRRFDSFLDEEGFGTNL